MFFRFRYMFQPIILGALYVAVSFDSFVFFQIAACQGNPKTFIFGGLFHPYIDGLKPSIFPWVFVQAAGHSKKRYGSVELESCIFTRGAEGHRVGCPNEPFQLCDSGLTADRGPRVGLVGRVAPFWFFQNGGRVPTIVGWLWESIPSKSTAHSRGISC